MSLAPLMGLPGKIKTLLDRIGSSTPTQLARLDDDVSSRAPKSTALSTSVWDTTKANRLDTTISSRASQASVNALPQGIVKNIQTGWVNTISPSSGSGEDNAFTNVTISEVTVSKSFVIWNDQQREDIARTKNSARLTSSTNLRVSCPDATSSSPTLRGRWTVIEYV